MKYPMTKSDVLRYYHINKTYELLQFCYDDGNGYSKKIWGMFILLDASHNIVHPDNYESVKSVWFIATSPLRGMEKNSLVSNKAIDIFALSKGLKYKTHVFNYSFSDSLKNPDTNFYFIRK